MGQELDLDLDLSFFHVIICEYIWSWSWHFSSASRGSSEVSSATFSSGCSSVPRAWNPRILFSLPVVGTGSWVFWALSSLILGFQIISHSMLPESSQKEQSIMVLIFPTRFLPQIQNGYWTLSLLFFVQISATVVPSSFAIADRQHRKSVLAAYSRLMIRYCVRSGYYEAFRILFDDQESWEYSLKQPYPPYFPCWDSPDCLYASPPLEDPRFIA